MENIKMYTEGTKLETLNIDGIECYELDGVVYLKLEDIAKGLGFTKTETKNGKQYSSVRWERVLGFLNEFGFDHKWAKDDFIPENIFYRLAMKAKNKVAEDFQKKIADEVIPTARRITCALETVLFQGNIDGLVYSKNGTATTTSRKIAEVFGKSHKEVLRLIDDKFKSTSESAQFCADHIIENIYIDSRNRQQREYELDEQGFSYIALGLTGYKADEFKIKYINAFSKMRQALQKMVAARIVEDVLPQDSRNRQYVYLIENTNNGAVKIGVAHDPEARLKQLQTGSVDELRIAYTSYLCSNAFQVESFMHQHFADCHIRGEWYQADIGDVVDVLEKQTYVLRSNFNNALLFNPAM
jgi:Rha family phage regulatory protein